MSAICRKFCVLTKRAYASLDECTGFHVANETDEVPGRRVESVERCRVVLTVGFVRVIADGFETEHANDLVAAISAGSRVNQRAHRVGLKEWWLFVGKEYEPQRSLGFEIRKSPSNRQ